MIGGSRKTVPPISSSVPSSPLGLITTTTASSSSAAQISPSGFTGIRNSASPSKMMSTPILAGFLTIKAPSSLNISPIGSSKSEGGGVDVETIYSIPTPLSFPKTPRTVTSAQDTPLHRAVQKVDHLCVDMLCVSYWGELFHFYSRRGGIVRFSSSLMFPLPSSHNVHSWTTWRLMTSFMTPCLQKIDLSPSLSTHKRSMGIHHS